MNIEVCKQLIQKLKHNKISKHEIHEILELFDELNFETKEITGFVQQLKNTINVPVNLMILIFKETKSCHSDIRKCTLKPVQEWLNTNHSIDTSMIVETLENALYIYFVQAIDKITNDIEISECNTKLLFSAWSRMGRRLGFQIDVSK